MEFNKTLWVSSISRGDAHIMGLFWSDPLTQSYGPWLVMQYAYRAIIISALLLCNYWLEFHETLWELSIPRGDAHIVALFRSDSLTQSYGPWLIMHYALRTNFYGTFNTKWRWAYHRSCHLVLVRHYPWLVMQYAYRAIIVSTLLLCNY
jgi:hypothetical protein